MKDLFEITKKRPKMFFNGDKTKYLFFRKQRDKDNISLCLPDLKINNLSLKQLFWSKI